MSNIPSPPPTAYHTASSREESPTMSGGLSWIFDESSSSSSPPSTVLSDNGDTGDHSHGEGRAPGHRRPQRCFVRHHNRTNSTDNLDLEIGHHRRPCRVRRQRHRPVQNQRRCNLKQCLQRQNPVLLTIAIVAVAIFMIIVPITAR